MNTPPVPTAPALPRLATRLAQGLLLALAALSAPAALPAAAATPAGTTDDGLEPVQARHIDKAWKRPGASLAGYPRILLRPVSVEFAKHWDPRDYGTFGLKSDDVERIRSSLAQLAVDTFARVLSRGGYVVATAPGEGVLEVEARLVDVYINAPETRDAGNVQSYVLSAGQMRLLTTLRDSVTGTALYRTSDLKRGPETGRLEWANSVWNRAEAERALDAWARQLKDTLDAARRP